MRSRQVRDDGRDETVTGNNTAQSPLLRRIMRFIERREERKIRPIARVDQNRP